jgi:hypothetical protein
MIPSDPACRVDPCLAIDSDRSVLYYSGMENEAVIEIPRQFDGQLDSTERQALIAWLDGLSRIKALHCDILPLLDLKYIEDVERNAKARAENALQVARKLNGHLDDAQRQALRAWLEGLLKIRASNDTNTAKIRAAITLTRDAHVVRPIIIVISKEGKRIGWDERSWPTRLGLSAAMIAAAVFGGEGAGLAAFGTAIGIPLWIVCGAGAAFAGVLLDELLRVGAKRDGRTEN